MTHRIMLVGLVLAAMCIAAVACAPGSARGQPPDFPATMAVEHATATAVYLFWRQDYRMLRACMTEAARAQAALTATAPPIIRAVPTPTPLGGRLGGQP